VTTGPRIAYSLLGCSESTTCGGLRVGLNQVATLIVGGCREFLQSLATGATTANKVRTNKSRERGETRLGSVASTGVASRWRPTRAECLPSIGELKAECPPFLQTLTDCLYAGETPRFLSFLLLTRALYAGGYRRIAYDPWEKRTVRLGLGPHSECRKGIPCGSSRFGETSGWQFSCCVQISKSS
jgi:hypothetical protein